MIFNKLSSQNRMTFQNNSIKFEAITEKLPGGSDSINGTVCYRVILFIASKNAIFLPQNINVGLQNYVSNDVLIQRSYGLLGNSSLNYNSSNQLVLEIPQMSQSFTKIFEFCGKIDPDKCGQNFTHNVLINNIKVGDSTYNIGNTIQSEYSTAKYRKPAVSLTIEGQEGNRINQCGPQTFRVKYNVELCNTCVPLKKVMLKVSTNGVAMSNICTGNTNSSIFNTFYLNNVTNCANATLSLNPGSEGAFDFNIAAGSQLPVDIEAKMMYKNGCNANLNCNESIDSSQNALFASVQLTPGLLSKPNLEIEKRVLESCKRYKSNCDYEYEIKVVKNGIGKIELHDFVDKLPANIKIKALIPMLPSEFRIEKVFLNNNVVTNLNNIADNAYLSSRNLVVKFQSGFDTFGYCSSNNTISFRIRYTIPNATFIDTIENVASQEYSYYTYDDNCAETINRTTKFSNKVSYIIPDSSGYYAVNSWIDSNVKFWCGEMYYNIEISNLSDGILKIDTVLATIPNEFILMPTTIISAGVGLRAVGDKIMLVNSNAISNKIVNNGVCGEANTARFRFKLTVRNCANSGTYTIPLKVVPSFPSNRNLKPKECGIVDSAFPIVSGTQSYSLTKLVKLGNDTSLVFTKSDTSVSIPSSFNGNNFSTPVRYKIQLINTSNRMIKHLFIHDELPPFITNPRNLKIIKYNSFCNPASSNCKKSSMQQIVLSPSKYKLYTTPTPNAVDYVSPMNNPTSSSWKTDFTTPSISMPLSSLSVNTKNFRVDIDTVNLYSGDVIEVYFDATIDTSTCITRFENKLYAGVALPQNANQIYRVRPLLTAQANVNVTHNDLPECYMKCISAKADPILKSNNVLETQSNISISMANNSHLESLEFQIENVKLVNDFENIMDGSYSYRHDFWFDGAIPQFQNVSSQWNNSTKTIKYITNNGTGFLPFTALPINTPNFKFPIKIPFLSGLANNGNYKWVVTLKITGINKNSNDCMSYCVKYIDVNIPMQRPNVPQPIQQIEK